MELLSSSAYYRPDFINPLLTDQRLDYLMYNTHAYKDSYASILEELLKDLEIHVGEQVENHGACGTKQLGGCNHKNNRKKALEFLLMSFVNVQGQNAFPIETTAGLFSTDEKHNGLLNSFSEVNYQDLYQLLSIFAGAKCKRELADAGNRIPNQNINPANINQAQYGNGNAAYNGNGNPANNGQNEVHYIGFANVAGGDNDPDGGFDANADENQPMVIYRYVFNGQDLHITLEERIPTNLIANYCQNWNDLAVNILEVWRLKYTGYNPPIYGPVRPTNCWPTAETIFGQLSNGVFRSTKWRVSNFEQVKMYLNCLLVIENVNDFAENGLANYQTLNQGGRILTHMFDLWPGNMEIDFTRTYDLVSEIAQHRSWLEFACDIHNFYTFITGIDYNHNYALNNVNAAKCWPGADTIFGNWNNGRFKSFNWPTYGWRHVRQALNCLLVIRYQ